MEIGSFLWIYEGRSVRSENASQFGIQKALPYISQRKVLHIVLAVSQNRVTEGLKKGKHFLVGIAH